MRIVVFRVLVMCAITCGVTVSDASARKEAADEAPVPFELLQSWDPNRSKSGSSQDWSDFGLSAGFAVLAGLGLLQASNAEDARDAAEALGQDYATRAIEDYASAAYWLALYDEDVLFHGGTSSTLLLSNYLFYFSEFEYEAGLASEQSDIYDDKNRQAGVWKGVAYASFAASAVFLIRGFTNRSASASRDDRSFGVITTMYPNPSLGMSYSF